MRLGLGMRLRLKEFSDQATMHKELRTMVVIAC